MGERHVNFQTMILRILLTLIVFLIPNIPAFAKDTKVAPGVVSWSITKERVISKHSMLNNLKEH